MSEDQKLGFVGRVNYVVNAMVPASFARFDLKASQLYDHLIPEALMPYLSATKGIEAALNAPQSSEINTTIREVNQAITAKLPESLVRFQVAACDNLSYPEASCVGVKQAATERGIK